MSELFRFVLSRFPGLFLLRFPARLRARLSVRSLTGFLLARVLAANIILAGCTPADRQFIEAGAGPDLMSQETVAATDSLESYFGEICKQADLPVTAGHRPRCITSEFTEYKWNTVVKAGMNDIDHRCDLYLTWLENKRNEKPWVNSTLVSLTTAAAGALAVAAPGNDDAFRYVSIALGLASQSYDAYYTRALLGLEPSTIKLTVESRRLQFRREFLNARYQQKVDVVAVLRSYLKLCTPQTITMDVNSFARAAVTGVEAPQVENLKLERKVFDTPRGPNDRGVIKPRPLPLVPKAVEQLFSGIGYTMVQVKELRLKFCVLDVDADNSRSLAAVRLWKSIRYAKGGAPLDPRISDEEWAPRSGSGGIRDLPNCEKRYFDVGENLIFGADKDVEPQFISMLKKVGVLNDGSNLGDKTVRDAIRNARVKCNVQPVTASNVNSELYEKVLGWFKKPEGSCGQI